MKKFIITIVIIFITISIVQSQTLNNLSKCNKYESDVKHNSNVSLRLSTVYTNVFEGNNNLSYYDDGFGLTLSLQIDLGKLVSLYGDINYSYLKYTNNNKEHSVPPGYFSGQKPSVMFILGTKFYPVRPISLTYIKTGIGILSREDVVSYPPIFNIGIGYEYKLSRIFNIIIESNANYYAGAFGSYPGKYPKTFDLSIGVGTSIYF